MKTLVNLALVVLTLVVTLCIVSAAMATTLNNSSGIQVLNLVDSNGCGVQNHLFHQVPEPAAIVLLLLGCCLVAIAGLRWKVKK